MFMYSAAECNLQEISHQQETLVDVQCTLVNLEWKTDKCNILSMFIGQRKGTDFPKHEKKKW